MSSILIKPIRDYTLQEWETLLDEKAFLGLKINRLAEAMDFATTTSLDYDSTSHHLRLKKKQKVRLAKVIENKSHRTFARFWHSIKMGCSSKYEARYREKIHFLASCIHQHIQLPKLGPIKDQEKTAWREYKALIAKRTFDQFEEILSPEQFERVKDLPYSEEHKIVLAQALKIKEMNPEAYTFIHAQKLSYWVINQLLKELAKLQDPSLDLSLFHFFRDDFDKIKSKPSDFLHGKVNDDTAEIGKKLLAVDGYFFHNGEFESANYFLKANHNIHSYEKSILTDIFSHFKINDPGLFDELVATYEEYNNLASIGNLYAICVPKNKVGRFAYPSHAFGKPCKSSKGETRWQVLDKLQNDEHEDLSPCQRTCLVIDYEKCQQFRVTPDQLNPIDNRVFSLSPVAKDVKDPYKEKIRVFAQRIHDQSSYH